MLRRILTTTAGVGIALAGAAQAATNAAPPGTPMNLMKITPAVGAMAITIYAIVLLAIALNSKGGPAHH